MQQHCYFHKNQYIQYFCALKQCTLPLCEQCLQIHEQQHRQKSQQPSVIPYREAYQKVFGNLSTFIHENKKQLQTLTDKVKKDKQEAINSIESYFRQCEQKIVQQSKYFSEIQQKFQKLKKGSIKTIIYYYSGDIALKQLKLPEFKQISSSLKRWLKNMQEQKKQQIQTFRQQKISQNEWSQSKIQKYQIKAKQHSKKKLIFQNDKSRLLSIQHKNTNQPYLQTHTNPKDQFFQKCSYEDYHRQKTMPQEQKSQVSNYFKNYRCDSTNSKKQRNNYKQNINTYKMESNDIKLDTNKYRGEFNNYGNDSNNVLGNMQIESHLGVQTVEKTNRALKELPCTVNQQYCDVKSKTLDKFPSMAQLKKGRQIIQMRLNNQEDQFKVKQNNYQFKPAKWSKQKYEGQNILNNERHPSLFTQILINKGTKNLNSQFTNRQPLKTTDLETYIPTPTNNAKNTFESRDRAASYQIGLRTTMSHNNLQLGKKQEPLLGQELKKQVLSPHEIRKMLEKKIQQRNKVLTQKKQHQLKINTDRLSQNQNISDKASFGLDNNKNSSKQALHIRQSPIRYDDQNINKQWIPIQQKTSLYNTKDSIINQIYRQTRY